MVFERAKNAFGPSKLTECNAQCRKNIECQTGYGVHSDVRACLGLNEDGSFFDDPILKLATLSTGTWRKGSSD